MKRGYKQGLGHLGEPYLEFKSQKLFECSCLSRRGTFPDVRLIWNRCVNIGIKHGFSMH